jgi:hypothetical protein
MADKPTTVPAYLAALPAERKLALEAVRAVINKNLDPAIQEGMQYGMIGYYIPHAIYPPGYHCDPKQPLPFAGLASQKGHMSLYMSCLYSNASEVAWLQKAWAATGKKLDMGKACIRFKNLDALPLDVLGQAFKRLTAKDYITMYEAALNAQSGGAKKAAKSTQVKAEKTAKPAAKKSAKKATKKAAKKAAARS